MTISVAGLYRCGSSRRRTGGANPATDFHVVLPRRLSLARSAAEFIGTTQRDPHLSDRSAVGCRHQSQSSIA